MSLSATLIVAILLLAGPSRTASGTVTQVKVPLQANVTMGSSESLEHPESRSALNEQHGRDKVEKVAENVRQVVTESKPEEKLPKFSYEELNIAIDHFVGLIKEDASISMTSDEESILRERIKEAMISMFISLADPDSPERKFTLQETMSQAIGQALGEEKLNQWKSLQDSKLAQVAKERASKEADYLNKAIDLSPEQVEHFRDVLVNNFLELQEVMDQATKSMKLKEASTFID
jgi:hypothetical protein